MKKRIAGILAAMMMFSVLPGVQASAENMISNYQETDISDDGTDHTSENTEDETDSDQMEDNRADEEEDQETKEPETDVSGDEMDVSFEETEEPDEQTETAGNQEEVETDEEAGETLTEEEVFSDDSEDQIDTYAGSNIPVQWVSANYKMRAEYAFTYAFRKGVTQLSYISRHNSNLNGKMHNWFGDAKGYTEAYCKTFYGCAIDDTSNTDAITAVYSNVGEYQGDIVDLRVTVPKWGTVNKDHIGKDGTKITPCVLFYKDKIAFNTISVGIVRFKFEFLKHGTSQQIYPKGHVTAMDLDGGQGIRTYDYWGVDRIYLRSGYSYLSVTSGSTANGNGYQEIKSKENSDSLKNSDVKGWCHLDFNGSFTINWLAQDSWKNSTGAQNAFYVSTGQTVGTYEPNPGPEKRVGDEGAAYTSMAKHEFTTNDPPYEITAGKKFDYVISQRVLPGTYSSFEVKDTLDTCLKYCGASVTTALGNNVTDKFQIQKVANTITFVAKTDFLETDEAYNDVTYYFRIKVQAESEQTIEAHNHYQRSNEFYSIVNRASRTLVSDKMQDTQTTNESWVKGTPTRFDGEITIEKRIKDADITWAHGNPVFRFRITGTDNKGISHVYETYVEFEQGAYTVNGEDATMRTVVQEIPAGRYTVSELQTLRYAFESVAAGTANVSVTGKTGVAVIDSENRTATVVFRNKKTRYDRYSHTDVVRNVIPVS